MTLPFPILQSGSGPPVLFIHGTAADESTWSLQFRTLSAQLHLWTWTRRIEHASVEAHAQDAWQIIHTQMREKPVVVGSSFGAIIALELARRFPDAVKGLVLIEPPLRPNDELPSVPPWFQPHFDALVETEGGPKAGEYFLRTVLGDDAFERMPKMFQERSKALWPNIRQDSLALADFNVRYDEMAAIELPTLLLGGDRSHQAFRPTLEALLRTLPKATLEIFSNAGHMLHAEAYRRFNERLVQFAQGL